MHLKKVIKIVIVLKMIILAGFICMLFFLVNNVVSKTEFNFIDKTAINPTWLILTLVLIPFFTYGLFKFVDLLYGDDDT